MTASRTAPPVTREDVVARCRSRCASVQVDDRVAIVGGRHAGTGGVLVRTAAVHQGHHVVRLVCGTVARISMAYVHRAECPLTA